MTELIESLEIKGFRGFSELTVPAFGKVNLITGKNNAGKSSLLEAIRILAARGSIRTIYEILDFREEINGNVERESDVLETDLNPFRSLFSGFSGFDIKPAYFTVVASGGMKFPSLLVNATWAIPLEGEKRSFSRYQIVPSNELGGPNSVPVLEVSSGEQERVYPLEMITRLRSFSYAMLSARDSQEQTCCVFLDPFSSRATGDLARLWDAISLTDLEGEVVKALQLVSPDIKDVAMVGSGGVRRSRIAKVRSQQFDTPVPLRTFGDGTNRLLGIILSLCNAKDGILLIDEFENGLHYSVQPLVWKTIFRLAGDLNVQVFATTHSMDCVRAFQKAATDSPHDGALIRLVRKDGCSISAMFDEQELEVATKHEIEVR